ncbi:MAG: LptF/LptG family permease [Deltaproteobacteria bacterium]|nr:LptF/LptG family permease [Deltaproteobacteria bacterium]
MLYPFFGGFVFFMFVFLMFQVVRLADYFINHGVGLTLLAKMTVYLSAAFLPVVMPVSFLVATLVGFGRLSADSEIVALKASGISLLRMYLPVALLSIIVAACVFYLTYFFIPWGNREFKKTIVKLGNTKVVSNLKEGTFTEGFFDLLVYADKVDVAHNKMSGVFIFDDRDSKNPMAILSKTGEVIPLKTESELSAAAILKLDDGSIHRSDIARNYYEKIDFGEYRIMLKVEEGRVDEIKYAKTLDADDLKSQMTKFEGDYSRYQEYAIEYWKRIALAIAPLLFGVLGVGLGVVRMRSVKSNAIFVAFAVVVVYWGLHIMGATLAEKGAIPPFLAMQISNLAVIPFAVASFRRSAW